jgi:hypothetical protein
MYLRTSKLDLESLPISGASEQIGNLSRPVAEIKFFPTIDGSLSEYVTGSVGSAGLQALNAQYPEAENEMVPSGCACCGPTCAPAFGGKSLLEVAEESTA